MRKSRGNQMTPSDKGPRVYGHHKDDQKKLDMGALVMFGPLSPFDSTSGYFVNYITLKDHDLALTKANAENLVLREEVAHEKLNYKIVEKSLDEAEATVNALKLALEDAQREANEQKELNRKLAEKLASANALILFNANKASDGAVMNHAHKLEAYRKEHTCNTTLPCKACESLTHQSQKGQGDDTSTRN